jgi:glycosyltransferase involved in cell wall biosynthesis
MPPPTGGMQTVMEQMMNLDIKEFNLISFNVSKNKLIKSNIVFNAINFIYRCLKLIIYLAVYNPDITHIHVAADNDFIQKNIFHNICKSLNKKTIIHTHGSRFKEWYASLDLNNKKKVKDFFNKSDAIIVLSDSWKKFYSKISSQKNIFVINNSIENIDFKIYKRIYPKKEFVVLFLSSICERKGTYDLLKVIKMIKKENFRFVFVGPYENKNKFFKEVDILKIRDRCEFIGEVLGKERFKYYASADVFVLPSYAEGLPVAILEAMSFGLPVISTKVGAIPEVIKKKNGILIEAGDINKLKDAIIHISQNKDKINYNKNNKSEINKRYTKKIFESKLRDAYDTI